MRIAFYLALLLSLPACTSVFYQPDRFLYYPPEKYGFHEREIHFKAGDGTQLIGWHFVTQGDRPKGLIVQFHGNGENMSSHYSSLVWLVKEGYDLFVFDYRGYGKSDGKATPEGVYSDSLAALQKAKELRRGGLFVIYGQSLGGAVAMRALNDFQFRNEVSLLVVESGFLSYKTVARRTLANHWLTWIMSPLAMILVSDEYSPKEAWPESRTPLLVIHDEKDPIVSFSNGEDVFEAANCKKDFWKLNDGGHIAAFSGNQSPMRARFVAFLESMRH